MYTVGNVLPPKTQSIEYTEALQGSDSNPRTIRDFPDHATFREKGAKLACADKLGVFLSLTLCNKANFDHLQQVQYDGIEKNVWIVFFFLI